MTGHKNKDERILVSSCSVCCVAVLRREAECIKAGVGTCDLVHECAGTQPYFPALEMILPILKALQNNLVL